MHKSIEYLICDKVESLGYFQLLDMRYDDRNFVTERVSTNSPATLLNLNTCTNFRTYYRVPEADGDGVLCNIS